MIGFAVNITTSDIEWILEKWYHVYKTSKKEVIRQKDETIAAKLGAIVISTHEHEMERCNRRSYFRLGDP